jgi:transposase-like protein
MTPLYKEHVLDFADLKLLGLVCKRCKAETILDISDINVARPPICPCCRANFEDPFTEAIKNFQDAYLRFTAKNEFASARIRIRSEAKILD